MPRIPVKLTKGEIVLPPHIAKTNMARLEEMNRQGLLARNMGGVAAYMANGGGVEAPQSFLQTQAGPQGAVGKLGQSLVHIGQREFGKASDALVPDAASGADSDLSNKQKALRESDKQVVELANEALGLVSAAAEAGDLIHGYVKFSDEVEAEVEGGIKGFWDKAKGGTSGLIQTVAGGHDVTRKIREEARMRIVSGTHSDSYRAYIRLQLLANQIVLPVLASGALGVNPTDADVKLAKEAQFDITAPSQTWTSQLNDLIRRSGGVAEAAEALATKTGNEETMKQVASGATQVEIKEETLVPQEVQGVAEVIEASENPSIIDKAKTKVNELIAPALEESPEIDKPKFKWKWKG